MPYAYLVTFYLTLSLFYYTLQRLMSLELLIKLQLYIIIILGDGRNDSPGHCAKYCTYTLMENESQSIVSVVIVDKRQVKLKATNMEKFGFCESMNALRAKGLEIVEVVTDASTQISGVMSKLNSKNKHKIFACIKEHALTSEKCSFLGIYYLKIVIPENNTVQ